MPEFATEAVDDRYKEFLILFSAHQKSIHGHIFHMLNHHHDAEDVFQKTSLVLWEKFDQFESGTNFRAWACKVAFYQARNFIRVSSRDRHVFNDTLLDLLHDERQAAVDELDCQAAALDECIQELRPKDKELVRQVYREDLTVRDIAKHMGKAAQTLYNRLNGIRRRLHSCVQAKTSLGQVYE